MTQVNYIREKIAECQRLLDASTDPLASQVYQAMLDEFTDKLVVKRVQTDSANHSRYRGRGLLMLVGQQRG